jgi:hypothetical protein
MMRIFHTPFSFTGPNIFLSYLPFRGPGSSVGMATAYEYPHAFVKDVVAPISAMRWSQAYKELLGWRRRGVFTSCRFVKVYHPFGGTCCFHLRPLLLRL